jgi:ABC-2 type transport system permease protein
VISGFRYGFLGITDSPLAVGAAGLLLLNIALWATCYALLKSGWKIKNSTWVTQGLVAPLPFGPHLR